MASMAVDDAITQTANRARALLFDREGKPKGIEHYLATLTLHTLIRPAKWFGDDPTKPGIWVFRWQGDLMVYDAGLAEIFLDECSDRYCDGILRNAAAVILKSTGGIADPKLRDYASRRLSGDLPAPTVKRRRGGNADKNRWRNTCLVGWLIPPLLAAGFAATRNDASEPEAACSIVSKALKRAGIHLSEKTIANIWGSYWQQRVVPDE